MSETFDLYCAASADAFQEGASMTLDGIDGFFDQYFDGMPPGETIRFAVLLGGPSNVPRSLDGLRKMPFVTARVERCDDVSGDVVVLSRTTLGDWWSSLSLVTESLSAVQPSAPDAPLPKVVAKAARDGSAYWTSGAKYWRSIAETSAAGAFRDGAAVRVIVLRTHGVFSVVARVNPPTAV